MQIDVWGEDEGALLVCREIQDVTADVKTFLFEPTSPSIFQHEPGQFVTPQLDIDGQPVSRCYTISSPPTRPYLLGITVKRQPDGLVSNWLHDTLGPGDLIRVDGPFGSFTPGRSVASSYLFLSAGSGATPLASMTRTAFDLSSGGDIVYVHSARTPADILFRRELEHLTNLAPRISVHHVCEGDAPGERWNGLRGRLTPEMLRLVVPDLHLREVYCCGPAPYMAGVRAMLADLGFDMSGYHEESFSFEKLPVDEVVAVLDAQGEPAEPDAAPAALVDAPAAPTYSIEFARSGRIFTCRADEKILDAAYVAGLAPASSCGQGLCGTCKSTMVSGSVDMQHQGGIRPREIAQNKVLICCSTPTSDVVIDA